MSLEMLNNIEYIYKALSLWAWNFVSHDSINYCQVQENLETCVVWTEQP